MKQGRLIDADALIEAYDRAHEGEPGRARQLILDAPTIEERTGKWFEYDSDTDKYDYIKCPFCGRRYTVDAYRWSDIGFTKEDLNFCPNCGAKMEG